VPRRISGGNEDVDDEDPNEVEDYKQVAEDDEA
jgi:hypothetical protein